MTLADFAAVMRRRWYVLLALLVCTVMATVAIPRDSGVYWSRVSVVFLPPVNPKAVGNVLEGSDPTLIYFAAAVERAVNGDRETARLSSSAATLYGTGVREGSSIALVDSGGQWRTNFNRPMIVIEAVDTTEARTSARISAMIGQVQAKAQALQTDAGSPLKSMIRTELSPARPEFTFVSGKSTQAVAAAGLLGLALSLAGTYAADRMLSRRARRRVTVSAI